LTFRFHHQSTGKEKIFIVLKKHIFTMEVGEVSDNGQILIPLPLRKKYNINNGDVISLKNGRMDYLSSHG